MSQEDYLTYAFLAVLALSSAASTYLWFVKRLRTGALIWSLYCIRSLCGLLAIGTAVMAWDILIEAAGAVSVLAFVGPIGLVGLLSVIPWSLTQRALVKSP